MSDPDSVRHDSSRIRVTPGDFVAKENVNGDRTLPDLRAAAWDTESTSGRTNSPVRSWTGATRRIVLRGVLGAVVTFLGLALLSAIVNPPFISADEIHHLDYAWRVGNGELPRFGDGITLPSEGPHHTSQWAFHHPPLAYGVLAPVVTPLLAAGHWRMATLVARIVVVLIGALSVVALAWATSHVTAGRDPSLVVGASLAGAVITAFVGVSSAVYNDALAVLLTVVALGLAASIARGTTTWTSVLALGVVCAAGSATRSAFVAVIFAVAPCLALGAVRTSRNTGVRRTLPAIGALLVLVSLPLAVSGWFYARNLRLTGSWTGFQDDFATSVLGRTPRSLLEVLRDVRVWRRGFGGLFAQAVSPDDVSRMWTVVPVIVMVAVGALAAVRLLGRARHLTPTLSGLVVAAMLISTAIAFTLMFFGYVARGGGWNPRYLLPALLPLCIVIAYGLLGPRRAHGSLLIAFAIVGVSLILDQAARMLRHRVFEVSDGAWRVWQKGAAINGLPSFVVPALLVIAIAGLAIAATALWRLTSGSSDRSIPASGLASDRGTLRGGLTLSGS